MIFAAAVFASIVSHAPAAVSGQAELDAMIRTSVSQVRKLLPSLAPRDRVAFYQSVGEAIEGIDDTEAIGLLTNAWIFAPGRNERIDAAASIGAIDPEYGRKLVSDEKSDRDWANACLTDALIRRHPGLALKRLTDYDYDYRLIEWLCDLGAEDPKVAGKFLRMTLGGDQQDTLRNVVGNLSSEDAARFLAAYGSHKAHFPADEWMVLHPQASAKECEQAAYQMPILEDRITLVVEAISRSRDANPTYAARLADSLCELRLDHLPVPLRDSTSAGDWNALECLLVPDVALVDTPKVRAYLQSLPLPKEPLMAFQLVQAWSNIDIAKATEIMDTVRQKHPGAEWGPHGISVDSGYVGYLINLVKTNPVLAAKGLGNHQDSYVCDEVIYRLWSTYPSQVIVFCNELRSGKKNLYEKPEDTVEYLQLRRRATESPLTSEPILKSIFAMKAEGRLLYVDASSALLQVMTKLAQTDVPHAIEISALQTDAVERARLLTETFEAVKYKPFSYRFPLLKTAFDVANGAEGASQRCEALTTVASQAKTDWQRLQPWPPRKK